MKIEPTHFGEFMTMEPGGCYTDHYNAGIIARLYWGNAANKLGIVLGSNAGFTLAKR